MIGLGFLILLLPVLACLAFAGDMHKLGLTLFVLWFVTWGTVFGS